MVEVDGVARNADVIRGLWIVHRDNNIVACDLYLNRLLKIAVGDRLLVQITYYCSWC